MCLEKKIEELTIAINRLTLAMSGSQEQSAPETSVAPEVQPTPEPAPVANPAPAPVATPAPEPTPAPAAPAVEATNVPFSNGQELVAYVMSKYKQLGPEKGSQIQNVMTGLGYTNINDIKPEHYAEFHQKVEAI